MRSLAIQLFVVAAVGAVLGAFGPFGSFAMPAPQRLLYWIGFLLGGFAVFRPLIAVGQWLAEAGDFPQWAGKALGLTLGALPVTLLVKVALTGFDWPRALSGDDFATIYAQVMLIGVLVNGLFYLLRRRGEDGAQVDRMVPGEPEPQEPRENPFVSRLPPGFGPLLALAGEDHYVRAIADGREALVLVRLRDAVSELVQVDGLQVHRSWWVARAAVREVRRDGRALTLVLANGREVPVARDKIPVLRQAGWL